jgi:hypothetical protein
MFPAVDIFRFDWREPVWLEPALNTDAAKSRIEALGLVQPGDYLIYDQASKTKVIVTVEPSGPSDRL